MVNATWDRKPAAVTAMLSSFRYLLITGLHCLFCLSAAIALSTTVAAADGDRSLQSVQTRGSLVIGTDIPYGVMEFLDESGKPTGIDIDIAREIATALNVELSIKAMPFDELFGAIDEGEIDIAVSAVTITRERQEELLFSVPYLDAGMSIAVAKDNVEIRSEADLGGKRVGVLKGTIGEGLMEKSDHVDQALLRRYTSNEKRLSDLIEGDLDAIIVHFLADNVPEIMIVDPPLTQSFYGIATRLENQSLMDEINATLRAIKRDGRLDEIKRKYIK